MARILCVEDSSEFQLYLSSILKEHNLTFAATISDSIRMTENGRNNFDLILLDVSLPDGNGMKILPKLKEAMLPRTIPIIILSSDNDILTKVAAFGIGADDYISKPPDPSELKARVSARLRWLQSESSEKSIVEYGDLTIDLEKMTVEIKGKRPPTVDLTPFEFKILRLLLSRPGQVFSREQIIDRIWGIGKYVTARTVDAHVSHLRKKIIDSQIQIETILSVGYRADLKGKKQDSGKKS